MLWMELRLKKQRESIALDVHAEHKDDRVLEIYDLSGLSFRQIHVQGLRMLSKSLGLCQANCASRTHSQPSMILSYACLLYYAFAIDRSK